jgi:hypothetical protein
MRGGAKTEINSSEDENQRNQNFPLEKSGVLCDLYGSESPHGGYPQDGLFEALIVGERVRPN